ncbi:MAG TPA: hypothetical protein VF681_09250 [Abditibacteriaceae bacterium]|jgi:hypothetical protein
MNSSRGQLVRSALLCVVFDLGCVGIYFDAENARLPIVGNSPPFNRGFAIFGGVFFLGMAFYGVWKLLRGSDAANQLDTMQESTSSTPIERAEERFSSMLPGHGIKEGHVPTTEEIARLVAVLDSPLSPMGVFAEQGVSVQYSDGHSPDDFWGPWTDAGEDMDYALLWIDRAPPEALDSLLKFLDANGPQMDAHDEDASGLAMLLGLWGEKRLEPWVQEIGARLNQPHLRAWALNAFSWATREELLPFLEPWVLRVNELSAPETSSLISALGEIGTPRALELLRQLESVLQNPSQEVQEILKDYLPDS